MGIDKYNEECRSIVMRYCFEGPFHNSPKILMHLKLMTMATHVAKA